MAAASYTSNLVDIYAGAGSISGWSALGGGASGLNAETDYFVQGTGCTSKNAFASSTKGMILADSARTVPTDGAIFLWITHQTANSLDSIASGGLQVLIGTSTTAFKQYYVGGSDTIIYDDRWLCIPVSYTISADATTGSPGATPSYFGVQSTMVGGPTKGAPLACDAIRFGRGYDYTNGDVGNGYATFAGAATYNDDITRRYGLIQLSGTTYKMQGLHKLGTSGTSVDFRDSNRNIVIANTLKVTTNFNGIEVNNASSNVLMTNISISALGTVSRGNFIVNNDATVSLVDCTFTDMETFTFLSNTSTSGTTYRRIGQINLGGGTITDCLITNSRNATSVSAATLNNITGTTFVSDGSNHAVELSSIGGGSMTWNNTLSGYVSGGSGGSPVTPTSTGNEAIYVNVGSGTLTINVADGATTPSIRSAGATVNVVAGLKSFGFTVNPAVTGYEWRIYEVDAIGSLTGAVELDGEESASLSSQSYSYAYSSDTPIAVQIIDLANDYVELIQYFTLKNSDQNVTLNLQKDNNN